MLIQTLMWNGWRTDKRSKWAAGKSEIRKTQKWMGYSLDKEDKLFLGKRELTVGLEDLKGLLQAKLFYDSMKIGRKRSWKWICSVSALGQFAVLMTFLSLPSALQIYTWNWMLTPNYLASKSSDYILILMCVSRVQNNCLMIVCFQNQPPVILCLNCDKAQQTLFTGVYMPDFQTLLLSLR